MRVRNSRVFKFLRAGTNGREDHGWVLGVSNPRLSVSLLSQGHRGVMEGPPLEPEEGEGLQSRWVEPEGSRAGLKESMGTQEHAGSEAALLRLEQ